MPLPPLPGKNIEHPLYGPPGTGPLPPPLPVPVNWVMPPSTCKVIVNTLWSEGKHDEANAFLASYCLITRTTREEVAKAP